MNNTTHPRTTRPINNRMPMRQGPGAGYGVSVDTPKHENVVLRREIGEVLRGVRQHQGRTLREVSSQARVSLGYLSEVERVMIPDTVPDELVRQQGVALR